jgi:hypothetical protein
LDGGLNETWRSFEGTKRMGIILDASTGISTVVGEDCCTGGDLADATR